MQSLSLAPYQLCSIEHISVLFSPIFKVELIMMPTSWDYGNELLHVKQLIHGGHTVNTSEILAVAINKKEK